MAAMRRFTVLDFLSLLLVLAIAAGARVGYVLIATDNAKDSGPMSVRSDPPEGWLTQGDNEPQPKDETTALRDSVRTSLAFSARVPFSSASEETSHIAPGYAFLLGLSERLWEERELPPEQFEPTIRWIQVGLGSLAAVFYYLFARRAFRSLCVGLLAGLLTALHPYWIIATAALDDTTLVSVTLALCLLLASQIGEKGGVLGSLLLGAAVGALPLLRAALLPFSFVLVVWFLVRTRDLKRGWLCSLAAVVGFAGALAPWTVRNWQLYQEPIPIVTSAHLHLWIGNNEHATGGPATNDMIDTLGKETHEEILAIESQAARYARLGKESFEIIRANPFQTLKRRIMAGLYFFFGQRGFEEGVMVNIKPVAVAEGEEGEATYLSRLTEAMPTILMWELFALFVLAIIGWRWTYGWRYESIPAALAIFWIPVPYILGHAEAMSGPRLPLDGVLLCYAAFTLVCFIPGIGGYLRNAADAGEQP